LLDFKSRGMMEEQREAGSLLVFLEESLDHAHVGSISIPLIGSIPCHLRVADSGRVGEQGSSSRLKHYSTGLVDRWEEENTSKR
jgi:hypothetical protein